MVMNNAMGELHSDEEEMQLKRRGRHSCSAMEIYERVRAARGALEVMAGATGSSDTPIAFFCHSWMRLRGL